MPPRPLSRRDLAASARRSDADVRARWARALARPDGEDALLVALLEDWSGFAGLDWPAMMRRIARAEEQLAHEFSEREPESPEDLVALYDETETLIPILLWWHATDLTPARCAVAAVEAMGAVGARRVLDFGCGIGSTALALAGGGLEVALAEVASEPLRFAEWRMRERGHAPSVVDLRGGDSALAPGSLDGAVAFDVLEHMPDITVALARIDRLLAPGGVLVVNQVYVPADEGPQHYPQRGEALRWLHARRYRLAHVRHVCWIAQKSWRSAPLQGMQVEARIAAARLAAPFERGAGRAIARRVIARALR